MTIQHIIKNEYQRGEAVLSVTDAELPFAMTIKPYKKNRSQEQNRLSHAWYAQVAATLREDTAAGVKGYCKLHFGVPILREDTDFSEVYDATIKTLSYEQKILIMSHPDLFPVTSLMKTGQLSLYLEQIQQHYADRVQLHFPDEPR